MVGDVDEAAARKAIEALDTTTFGRWVEVNVQAIESETRGAPPARTPDEATINNALGELVAKLPDADTTALGAMSSGGTVTDDAACAAYRDLYALMADYDQATLAQLALYDVSP